MLWALIKKVPSSIVRKYYSFIFIMCILPLFYTLFFRKTVDGVTLFDGVYVSSQLLLLALIIMAWYELDLNNFLWIFSRVKVADFKKAYLIFMGSVYLIINIILLAWLVICTSLSPNTYFGNIPYQIFLLSWLTYESLVIGWFIALVSVLTLHVPLSLRNAVLIITYAYLLEEYLMLLSLSNSPFSILIISYHIASAIFGYTTINHIELGYYLLIYLLFLMGLMKLSKRDL